MNLPRLWPGQEVGDPFLAMRREMENVFGLPIKSRRLPALGLAHRQSVWRKQTMPSK